MQIKRIIIILLFSAVSVFTKAQDGVDDLLSRLSKTVSSYKCLYFEYTMTTEDLHRKTSVRNDGKVLMKGNKYRLSTKEVDVYSDGVSQWQYLKEDNEVTIFTADSTADIIVNPFEFLLGDMKAFKRKLKGEVNEDGFPLLEIDFYPWDLKTPYSYIRVRIENSMPKPYSIKYVGKDGVNYTIKIKHYTPDTDVPEDGIFVFDATKHPDVEIVDLRE